MRVSARKSYRTSTLCAASYCGEGGEAAEDEVASWASSKWLSGPAAGMQCTRLLKDLLGLKGSLAIPKWASQGVSDWWLLDGGWCPIRTQALPTYVPKLKLIGLGLKATQNQNPPRFPPSACVRR